MFSADERKKILELIAAVSVAKGTPMSAEQVKVWYGFIRDDLAAGKISADKIIPALKSMKNKNTYGKMDYAFFYEECKADLPVQPDAGAEEAWQEVLLSAGCGGRLPLSARAAKAVNSLGGLWAVRTFNRDEMHWMRRDFLEAYKNTPEPRDADFRCYGLQAPMILRSDEKKLLQLEGVDRKNPRVEMTIKNVKADA